MDRKCPGCGGRRIVAIEPQGRYLCQDCGDIFDRVFDLLEVWALDHARQCDFKQPVILARASDMRMPLTAAFWVGDKDNPDARAGIVVNRFTGVLTEFNAHELAPGELPPGGVADLIS